MDILFAVDLTEPRSVTDNVAFICDRLDARLWVLHVFEVSNPPLTPTIDPMTGIGDFAPYALYDPDLQHDIEAAEEEAFKRFLAGRFKRPVRPALRWGDPAESILEDAEEHDVDLIILGKHHYSRLERLLISHCTSRIIERTTRPVLLIPIPKDEG